ncbi:hypothetical protein [Streptomyces sp. NPDC056987]|uniref:hypothetical protein n=1 Tax=Streptomyces sp. NPDC056987 TaxID=3345988 RepID=UPI0036297182
MQVRKIPSWVIEHPDAAAVMLAAVLAGAMALAGLCYLVYRQLRRVYVKWSPSAAVLTGTLGALLATLLGADTAWRFAGTNLNIDNPVERAGIFLVGETILFAMALMARANVLDKEKQAAGTPGILVWVMSCVLAIPAISLSQGFSEGAIRVLLGPFAAALLWHFVMGIELRTEKAGQNQGVAAKIFRHYQTRVLSRIGVLSQDVTAEELARERALVRAAALSGKYEEMNGAWAWRRARVLTALRKQLRAAGVANDEELKAALLSEVKTWQQAPSLGKIQSDESFWQPELPGPGPAPRELEQTEEPAALPVGSTAATAIEGDAPYASTTTVSEVPAQHRYASPDVAEAAAAPLDATVGSHHIETRIEREAREEQDLSNRTAANYQKAVEVVKELVALGEKVSGPRVADDERVPVGPRSVQRYFKKMTADGIITMDDIQQP